MSSISPARDMYEATQEVAFSVMDHLARLGTAVEFVNVAATDNSGDAALWVPAEDLDRVAAALGLTAPTLVEDSEDGTRVAHFFPPPPAHERPDDRGAALRGALDRQKKGGPAGVPPRRARAPLPRKDYA